MRIREYANIDDLNELAEELENFDEEELRYYFDFEAYGRDMDYNGHFAETDSGYIEIFN